MWGFICRKIQHKYRWLDKLCHVVFDLIIIGAMLYEALIYPIYHWTIEHWYLKRKHGYCWLCRSYENYKENTRNFIKGN